MNPILALQINKSISVLERLADHFYKQRLFALEDLCDKIRFYYLNTYCRSKCKFCDDPLDAIDLSSARCGMHRICYYDYMRYGTFENKVRQVEKPNEFR